MNVSKMQINSLTVYILLACIYIFGLQNQLETAPPHELKNIFHLLHEILVSNKIKSEASLMSSLPLLFLETVLNGYAIELSTKTFNFILSTLKYT